MIVSLRNRMFEKIDFVSLSDSLSRKANWRRSQDRDAQLCGAAATLLCSFLTGKVTVETMDSLTSSGSESTNRKQSLPERKKATGNDCSVWKVVREWIICAKLTIKVEAVQSLLAHEA